jgi:hypothetical protein
MNSVTPAAEAWAAAGASPALPTTITARHRERRAYVYVRQSSPHQVQHHRESQQNQYALVRRAIALGWRPAQIHVIDADLGQSGQDSRRQGFRELVAEVSLGHVGLVLAYEASRLARNNALCRRRHKLFYAAQRLMPRCLLGAGLARSVES